MTNSTKLDQFQAVLSELQALLQAEGVYGNFASLFRRASELAAAARTDPDAFEALREYFSYMPSASGTFRDLVIWRDSFEERKAINEKLEFLREQMISMARNL